MQRISLLSLALVSAPALAQQAPAPAPEDNQIVTQGEDIVVVATRLRGQVDAPQPPILTLDEEDVAAYGAATIDDLLTAISPQTGSGRGRGGSRPVVLLNGQRVSSFRELRGIPPEAIRRLEVLPEEVALRFGYVPNQRVVNFILKDDFSSTTLAGEYDMPTRGGFADWELEGGLLRIDGPSRLNLEAEIEKTTLLTEAERGLSDPDEAPTVSGDPDPAAFRSLIDESRQMSLNGTWSTGLGEEGMAGTLSLNGAITRTDTRALSGLDAVLLTGPDGTSEVRTLAGPLVRDGRTTAYQAGFALNKPLGAWQLSVTGDGSFGDARTLVDRDADVTALVAAAAAGTLDIAGPLPVPGSPGRDIAREKDLALGTLTTLRGSPFRMPAGEASLTLDAGFDYDRTRSSDTRTGRTTLVLDRSTISGGANLSLPIASKREDVLAGLGDVTLNLSAGVDRLSDFGTLSDWTTGLTWKPTGTLTLQATYIVSEAAPSLGQLGGPQIVSRNVPVYDFVSGDTVLAAITTGGNPDLAAEKQRDVKLSAEWDLPFLDRSNLVVEYFRNRSTDVTQSFPLLTPAIEAAFPSRVTRDAAGTLVAIDRRPVTFDEIESSRLRWGLNLSGEIGGGDDEARGQRAGRDRGERQRGRGGPGGFMGRGGDRPGRWNLALYHTWRFTETATIAQGGPVLDLLGGDALAAGGVARHSFELEGGVFHKGLGARLRGNWTAPVTVSASGAPGSSDLRFGSVFELNARFFVSLDRQEKLVAKYPFLEGTRVSLTVDNILDSRQRVTNEAGEIPYAYQPAFRDPRGRVIGIDIRKMF
ncbi:TonB-dependent receptor domain-containing protein [Novosphingobium marinum]|uniref:TonB-dependent receptor-like beta-barrel domain-containing protein n=1 Tax=Novosphingobium marinum TaxID=1514948 RepID=A0A7Y9XWN5_9SPHN|nr:TonB-dependent receptor [Novosphingobium marinum]NYH94456.1 hypothetical protein [Novosphingobium marinum]